VSEQRVRVAAVNDYELIVAGLADLLAKYEDRIIVCERILVGQPVHNEVDVALYDTYGRRGIAAPILKELVASPLIERVALFSLDLTEALVDEGRQAGATGFISKSLSGDEIADAIVRVARGDDVVATVPSPRPALRDLDWPGKDDGLTERESEVLVLLAEGLSNREIGAALYLSPETIKSHVRSIFSKLGFRNRVEATNHVHRSGVFRRHESTVGHLD
jgi:DNA-binding NarL/FixJ family response regulator